MSPTLSVTPFGKTYISLDFGDGRSWRRLGLLWVGPLDPLTSSAYGTEAPGS